MASLLQTFVFDMGITTNSSLFQQSFAAKANVFRRLSRGIAESPTKKCVHDLRVTARQLRAMLWVLQQDASFSTTRICNTSLKQLMDDLGELRELDVAFKDGKAYHLQLKRLKQRRQVKEKKLYKSLNEKNRKKILAGLTLTKELLRKSPQLPSGEALQQLDREVQEWQSHKLHKRSLHELRITMKKIRYVLEAFHRPVKPLQKLQDVLGSAHDLYVLTQLAGKNKKIRKDEKKFQEEAQRQAEPCLHFVQKQLQLIKGPY